MKDTEDYLDPKVPSGAEPYVDHSLAAIGPCCLDINTKTAWFAKSRGGGVWLGIWLTITLTAIVIALSISDWVLRGGLADDAFGAPLMAMAFIPLTLRFVYSWRNDRPVRFNRLRREVYFQHRDRVFILDWDAIRAYTEVATGVVAGGARVRDPELNIVFITDSKGRNGAFSLMGAERLGLPLEERALGLWEYIRLYMEEGPEFLPPPEYNHPQYRSMEEVTAALNPLPLRASHWWSWPLEIGLFFPGRVLFFLITYPTDWIYLKLAERLEVKPYADEIIERCSDSEPEAARRKRFTDLKRRYRARIREIPREIARERESLLLNYASLLIRFFGAVPFGEAPQTYRSGDVPPHWFRTALTDLVEVNPRGKPPSGEQPCFIPLEAIRKEGIMLNRRRLGSGCPEASPTVVRNGDVIFPAGPAWLEEDRVAVVTVLDEPMPDEQAALARAIGSHERACGPTGLLVFRPRNLSPAFAYCLAQDPRLKEHVKKKAQKLPPGAPLPPSVFDDFFLPKPPAPELKRFERDVLDPKLQKIVELEREGIRLRTRYRRLLDSERRPADR